MPPRWLAPWCAASFVLGGLMVVLGPVASYYVARASATRSLSPEERLDPGAFREALTAELALRAASDRWVMPVGFVTGFFGFLGLLYAWVARPVDLGPGPGRPPVAPPGGAPPPRPSR